MVLIFLSRIPINDKESTPDISIFFFRIPPYYKKTPILKLRLELF